MFLKAHAIPVISLSLPSSFSLWLVPVDQDMSAVMLHYDDHGL